MFDEPAAENWSHGRGDGGEAGPNADRLAAIFFVERCADDGEAAGHEEGGADALDAAREHELLNVGSESAGDGSGGEDSYTDHEHQTTTVEIAERTTHQNQRCQKQAV